MPIIKKDRIEFIDLAKGVCILLVVMIHTLPEWGEKIPVLACMRMPLYFCLSGLFFKDYGSFRKFSIKKTNNILIPFVAWYIIGYIIYYLGRAFFPSGTEATYHFNDILFRNAMFNLPIWFLLCLFWSNMLFTGIVTLTRNPYLRFLCVIVAASIGLLASKIGVFNFLYIGSSLTCLPFFYLGYALKRTTLLYPDSNKKKDFWIMALCLGVASIVAFVPDVPPRLDYCSNKILFGNVIEIYICASLLVVGVLLLCKFIGNIPFVSWIGRYSIIVLVCHMWLKDIYLPLSHKLLGSYLDDTQHRMLVLFTVILSMIVLIPFCKKYLPYITAQKELISVNENNSKEKLNRYYSKNNLS